MQRLVRAAHTQRVGRPKRSKQTPNRGKRGMNMSKKEIPDFTQNRELSWLRFNQRVLEEARDESVPLMERMKFVAIFTSNLDEFFMIRVGSLYDLAATDDKKIDQRSGMTAKQQLDAIYRAVSPLYKERDKTYAEIKKQLHPYGVCGLDFKELEQQEKKFVKKYFKEEVLPVLSPQIVDANHPFPHLMSKEIYVVANLKQGDKAMLGIIPVPQYISNILYLPGYDIRYIRMEKIILEFAELVFNQYQVSDKNYICVTRNADVSPDDEAYADHGDFRPILKEPLHTGIDAVTHCLEAYASMMATDYTDGLAIRSLQMIFQYLPRAYDNGPNDPVAREKMANAATMAGMAFANAFLGVCHSMAHKLGAFHHLPHGVANALMIDYVLRFNAAEVPAKMGTFPQYDHPHTLARYAEVADALGVKGRTDADKLEGLIKKIDELKDYVGIKKSIQEYGVDEKYFLDTLDDMVEQAFDDQCTGANPRLPLMSEIKDMYLRAYYGKE